VIFPWVFGAPPPISKPYNFQWHRKAADVYPVALKKKIFKKRLTRVLFFTKIRSPIHKRRKKMIGKHVLVRTRSAGVHVGTLKSKDGKEVVLTDSRRIWYWDGAATISQLAIDGTSKPENGKFPAAVPEILLTEAIEIIPLTQKARDSIAGVKEWKL
jgi:hypothetical protein